ncbi:2-hydroxymuconic semialdehyde dehydrogenase [Bdellovibrio sp. qaytius]|nr:2-hydroxymuconic semialdehyde dehydrogenase [Bdellovibrio sp. qaytius]
MDKILNYINGEFVAGKQNKFLDNINPATGQVYSLIPDSDASDVEAAVKAAELAFPAWSKLTAEERANYLNLIAAKIIENLDALAKAESIDNGKPFNLAQTVDIPRSAKNFNFFADAISALHGESFRTNKDVINYTDYSALGVVACISPWNLPLYLLTWKIAPALVAGNTVVAKPSEVTPMTAYLLAKICAEVGLPKGVLNIIHGLGPSVGSPLVSHKKVKAITFTGSTQTGKSIAQATAGQFKKLALEMGGKNANIIFADCDFEKTLETTLRSTFSNQGQICLCGSRLFIEKSIYEKFKTALVEKTKQLKQGDPLKSDTDQGALVSELHMNKVLQCINHAKAEGGTILCGGNRKGNTGYFVEPTLIEGVAWDSKTNQEEIFGPVATLIPFTTEEELLQMVNSTTYGLACSIWTNNIHKAQRVAHLVETGVVWINTWMLRDLRTPFGGVKESGYGREGGLEALKFFSEVKNICIQTFNETRS